MSRSKTYSAACPELAEGSKVARLSDLARREADLRSPDFSEVRHARIMRAVESVQGDSLPIMPPKYRTSWLAPMALAAGIALAAGVGFALLWHRPSAPQSQLVIQKPVVPQAPRIVATVLTQDHAAPAASSGPVGPISVVSTVDANVQGAMETAMAEQQWVGLDRDVRTATRYLVDQFPLRAAWQSDSARDQQ